MKNKFDWDDKKVIEFARICSAGAYGSYEGCATMELKMERFKQIAVGIKKKYIVWLVPSDIKKVRYNQFHTEANSVQEAVENCNANADFKLKIMGVGGYEKVGVSNDNFINNKFY